MRTALIDGDILIYRIASALEQPVNWGEGLWTLHVNEFDAKGQVAEEIERVRKAVQAGAAIIALTDWTNWRKDILPSYKSNRKAVRKPVILPVLRAWLEERYYAYIRPGLEADDILGILATSDQLEGEKIICSIDKDLKTIPGLHYAGEEVFEVSENEADYWHMYQTLTGDSTDGYSGCPGCGPKTAEKILNGTTEWWHAVVKAFLKAGLSEEEALIQARVARICRSSDYDFTNKKVIPWTPLATTPLTTSSTT